MTTHSIPAIVLGGTGYVGAEFIRLIAGHARLQLHAAVSGSAAGAKISDTFPHLHAATGDQTFCSLDQALNGLTGDTVAVFAALPHGSCASVVADVIERCEAAGVAPRVVDASADFRFADQKDYDAVYHSAHGAPQLLAAFDSAVPELLDSTNATHIGHPGCFATAMQLAIAPLLAVVDQNSVIHAVGITGSTGSGKQPSATTHTPERHSNLFAYKPLEHRHTPEVIAHLARLCGYTPDVQFVPHSGPFARGIHMTVMARLSSDVAADELHANAAQFYADKPFVRVVNGMPRIKNVVASNYADIGIAANGRNVVATCVIDNLIKGAAGGSVQWMNRLLSLPETSGLTQSAPAWT
ncbi:MAG: N-acetyl-gamma-glutamyl-phosphate reductase [Pseudomonadota bacterium]